MQDSQIWKKIYILAGVTLFLLIVMGAAWGFAFNRPLLEKIEKARGEVDTLNQQAAKLPDALKARALAQEKKEYVQAQLYFFQNRYRHLTFDYGAPTDPPAIQEAKKRATWQRWMDEYHLNYGIALKNELYRIARGAGVSITTAIKVSPPPQMPEELPPTPKGFLKPISENNGTLNVTVVGAYPEIINFFNLINTSNILMTVGTIKLEGTSPNIRVSFPITPYLVENGPAVQVQGAAPPPAAEPVAPPPTAPPDDSASEPADEGGSSKSKGADE